MGQGTRGAYVVTWSETIRSDLLESFGNSGDSRSSQLASFSSHSGLSPHSTFSGKSQYCLGSLRKWAWQGEIPSGVNCDNEYQT